MTVSVYVIGPYGGPYKIGIASDVNKRLAALQTASPVMLQLIVKKDFADRGAARAGEKAFHDALGDHRMTGEWFSADIDKIKDLIAADEEYEVTDHDAETKQWFRGNMRQLSEFARSNLAKFYGLNTIDPDVLADFRSAQVIAGRV